MESSEAQSEIISNTTIKNTEEIEILQSIHNDLGIITCFIIFIVLVIILKYIYKFFNMLFTF